MPVGLLHGREYSELHGTGRRLQMQLFRRVWGG